MLNQNDLKELLLLVRGGDETAFRRLHDELYPLLIGYGSRLGVSRETVHDCTQDLVVWIWQERSKLAKIEKPLIYFYRTLRNRILREIKLEGRRKLVRDNIDHPDVQPVEEDNVSHRYLVRLMNDLPPRQREVIYLRYFRAMSYTEISEVMSVSAQVAKNYAQRALGSLRRHTPTLRRLLEIVFLLAHTQLVI